MSGHDLNPTLLRKYDIRGVVGDNLGEEDARAIGRTFGSIVAEEGGSFVCVGRDGRLSSSGMAAALIDGFRQSGIRVVDIGLAATPMLYFASKMLNAGGAIMVTGSHNPPNYNGFKLVLHNAPFWSDQIRALGERSAKGDWCNGKGAHLTLDVQEAYVHICLLYIEGEVCPLTIAPIALGATLPERSNLVRPKGCIVQDQFKTIVIRRVMRPCHHNSAAGIQHFRGEIQHRRRRETDINDPDTGLPKPID